MTEENKKDEGASKPKKIGIMVGSDSDLPQCINGLLHLRVEQTSGKCEVVTVITNSIHRNTEEVLQNLKTYNHLLDAWIIGAGLANHLTGTCDAYLRYTLKNNKTRVFGVAFGNINDINPNHIYAAILSITMVPSTQVIYCGAGEQGFLKACKDAISNYDELPRITIGAEKPVVKRTLEQTIQFLAKK